MGQYKFIDHIGSGGFGNVDLVTDKYGQHLAKKTFSINQPQPLSDELKQNVKKRFIREANVQSELHHDNIVPVLYKDLATNPPFFIMPLAISSLDEDMKANRTLNGNFKTALMDILSGLEELHSLGIFHRDLKPQNVLKFSDDEANEYYAISDFGLMSIKDTQISALTQTGMRMGSDYYTAPEIVADLRRASKFSDIFSVGCILHDFVGTNDRIPCNEITNDTSPYADIIGICTRREANRRFPNVSALREALLRIDSTDISFVTTDIVAKFISDLEKEESLDSNTWYNIINYVEDHDNDDDVLLLFQTLPLQKIKEIVQLDIALAARLGEKYSQWVSKTSFNFSECDGICNRLLEFFIIPNLSCKVEILLALLFMGTSHNRWYVERKFVNLTGQKMPVDLAKRLALEISILPKDEIYYAVNHLQHSLDIDLNVLHPNLIEAIQRVCACD